MFEDNATAPPPGPPPPACAGSSAVLNSDAKGGDLAAQPAPTSQPSDCVAMCCLRTGCVAYVFVPRAPSDFKACSSGQACCYLKHAGAQPHPSHIPGILFGRVSGSGGGNASSLVPPPLGIRSAVPLGGIGAGSFELRGDLTLCYVMFLLAGCQRHQLQKPDNQRGKGRKAWPIAVHDRSPGCSDRNLAAVHYLEQLSCRGQLTAH